MTTDTLPTGVGIRLLGGKSREWAEGYRRGHSRESVEFYNRLPMYRDAASRKASKDFVDGYKEGWEARERSNDDED